MKSFALTHRAKKAIIKRGWIPCNYCLLDHPEVIVSKKDKILVENHQQEIESDSLTTSMNLTGSRFTSCLDNLIDKEMKDEGRREKFLQEKERRKEANGRLEALVGITKLTSGKLAANNHFCLTTKEVLDLALKKQEHDDLKANHTALRKHAANEKAKTIFKKSFLKYKRKQNLQREDLTALIRQIKEKDDGPIPKTVKDLQLQFERVKHRLDIFLLDDHESVPPHHFPQEQSLETDLSAFHGAPPTMFLLNTTEIINNAGNIHQI